MVPNSANYDFVCPSGLGLQKSRLGTVINLHRSIVFWLLVIDEWSEPGSIIRGAIRTAFTGMFYKKQRILELDVYKNTLVFFHFIKTFS